MNNLKKKKNTTLLFAVITSIALPLGIPGIVLGAVFGIWVLMGFCILIVMASFYACPLLWVSFGRKKYLYNLATKIEVDGVYSIDSLSHLFGVRIDSIMNDIRTLISKRYLPNYLIDEATRMIIIHEKERKLVTFFCPSCGASIVKNSSNKYVCDYCHTSFEYK